MQEGRHEKQGLQVLLIKKFKNEEKENLEVVEIFTQILVTRWFI